MARSVLIGENLRFDARLAVIHETERWLAVADLHYGYEISLRAAGALVPNWGMHQIEQRLEELIAEYAPQTVLFLGDLVHTAAAAKALTRWIRKLEGSLSRVVCIRGNHDNSLRDLDLHDHWHHGDCIFHHGHRIVENASGDIVFSGHLHPSRLVSDGAGFARSLPALCRTPHGWILPAFSPWAAGGSPVHTEITECWVSNTRITAKIQRIAKQENIFV